MTKPPEVRRDWFKTGVHFIFGAVLGAFLGGVIAARHVGDRPGWVMLLVVLRVGLVTYGGKRRADLMFAAGCDSRLQVDFRCLEHLGRHSDRRTAESGP